MPARLLFAINITSKGPITSCMFFHTTAMQMTPNCKISNLLADMSTWMQDVLIFLANQSTYYNINIKMDTLSLAPTKAVHNLGIMTDSTFSVATVSGSCRFVLFIVRKARPFVRKCATQPLVKAMVITCVFSCLKQAHVIRLLIKLLTLHHLC